MPNRIIRDGILTSDAVHTLSTAAEVFYRRLMSVVDDFARFDGRLSIIRASCYPLLLDKVSEKDVQKWMQETMKAGLVKGYVVDNKPYILYLNFKQHVRATKSKYPEPSGQMITDATQLQCTRSAYTLGDGDGDGDGDVSSLKDERDEEIYQAYPRKIGKQVALKAIRKACEKGEPVKILEATKAYAEATAGWDRQFIPHPATWFNRGSYDDDRAEWVRSNGQQPNGTPKPKSTWELKQIVEAKRGRMKELKDRHYSHFAMGGAWDDASKEAEYRQEKKDAEALESKMRSIEGTTQ